MSILIRGMKMPSECEYCGFCRYYPENGNVWCNATNRLLKQQWKEPHWTHLDVKRPEWCPLIELPEKHGRLIDADALEPDADYDDGEFWAYSLTQIRNAPTIHQELARQEIIRCKDCKHRDPEDKKCDCGHGITWQLPRPDEWFCADAERRTDE